MTCGERRPCTMATVTGKKHRYIAITALGATFRRPRLPRITSTMGAIASTGTVCEATIHGSSARSSVRECTMQHGQHQAQQRAQHKTDQRGLAGHRHMEQQVARANPAASRRCWTRSPAQSGAARAAPGAPCSRWLASRSCQVHGLPVGASTRSTAAWRSCPRRAVPEDPARPAAPATGRPVSQA
jgi:hypothetical protein